MLNEDYTFYIAIECDKTINGENCENVLTPTGMQLLQNIDDFISNDKIWSKICCEI